MICDRCGAAHPDNALFCSRCGSKIAQPNSAADVGEPTLHGERRQIAALFCDLVDSTVLAVKLDPEEFHDIVRAFATCCENVVAGFEGHVSDVRGDGALIFFGYPAARGDESERAIRAALDIVEAVGRLSLPNQTRLRVRIGIATGVAAVDARNPNKPTFAGEVLNLAARLQGLAEPNTVVISPLTKRLGGGFFDWPIWANARSRVFRTRCGAGVFRAPRPWGAASRRCGLN
jgi:class 3 adenylate cyclase